MPKLFKRNPFLLFLLLIAAGLTAGITPSRFILSPSPSLDYHLFLKGWGESQSKIKKGSYVSFEQKDEEGNPLRLIKKAACCEDEVLSIEGDSFYCNGEFLGKRIEKNSRGMKMPVFIWNGVIPKGYLFVSGSHPRSYDSRYFGFIKKEDVKTVNYPIF